VFVCEGESDAAWLLQRCAVTDAVFCLHARLMARKVEVLITGDAACVSPG
jgi:hypothetical protein